MTSWSGPIEVESAKSQSELAQSKTFECRKDGVILVDVEQELSEVRLSQLFTVRLPRERIVNDIAHLTHRKTGIAFELLVGQM